MFAFMSVRDRIPRMRARMLAEAASQAAREDSARVIEEWNSRIREGRPMWSPPSLRAAIVAGYSWLEVYCPARQTSRAIDARMIDRQPEASVARSGTDHFSVVPAEGFEPPTP